MAAFGYEALNSAGKTIKGSVNANTIEDARTEVKKQGLILVDIKKQSALTRDLNIKIGGWPKPRDLSVYCRQFVSMIRAGVTIIEALKMLAEQTENDRLKEATEGVMASVKKGETLADSLEEFPKIYPSLLVSMVRAGEASGSLDVAMERMATHFEKSARTKALVKKAMIYPIAVIVVTIIVVIVMLTVVIPSYTEMFSELGADLPGITKAVQGASNFLIDRWYIIVAFVVAAVVIIRAYVATDKGRHFVGKLRISIPVLKNLEVKQASSQVARTLSTLLAAGVPLVECVEIVSETMGNILYREALEDARGEIMIGHPLSRPMEECQLFPPMVYHMVRIGEETGNTEDMLTKLADYYDEEVEVAVQSLMAAMEPMIIVILAAVVLVIVGACLAPMMTLYNSIG